MIQIKLNKNQQIEFKINNAYFRIFNNDNNIVVAGANWLEYYDWEDSKLGVQRNELKK